MPGSGVPGKVSSTKLRAVHLQGGATERQLVSKLLG